MPSTWDEAVYNIIAAHSGVISLQEIYQDMKNHPLVTPYHREPWQPGKQPRCECWIRRSLTNLTQSGQVRRAEKGLYIVARPGVPL